MGILDRFNIGKQFRALKPWFEDRKIIRESPKPPKAGHRFVPGTQIQAPQGSDLLRRGRGSLTPTQASPAPIQQPKKISVPRISGRGRITKTTDMSLLPNVEDAIFKAATKYDVPASLLYDIAFSESSLDPRKRNISGEGLKAGTPKGLFQFTPGTWDTVLNYSRDPASSLHGVLPTEDVFDPYTNALAAAYLIKFGQLGKWDASEWNWGEHYDLAGELEELGFYEQSKYHKAGTRASIRLGGK